MGAYDMVGGGIVDRLLAPKHTGKVLTGCLHFLTSSIEILRDNLEDKKTYRVFSESRFPFSLSCWINGTLICWKPVSQRLRPNTRGRVIQRLSIP